MSAINSNKYIKRELPYHQVKDSFIVLDPFNAKTHELNSSAFFVWESLSKPMAFEKIPSLLEKEYSLSREVAYRDSLEFVEKLLDARLIEKQ